MLAFVGPNPAAPLASASSRFVTGTTSLTNARVSQVARRPSVPSMSILDGLDTVNQDSYSFSRYILGPFQPTVLSPNSSQADRDDAIRAAYRHVFGNAYIMEEERAELAVPESQFKLGALSAREFVRAIAKSSAYKTRFFEGASQYRFIELNFMHLLGRAPDSRAEITEHLTTYNTKGVDADIDSYIDSAEYMSVFGEDNIPFLRFRGAYTPCDSFNKQCALKGGWANSDKAMGSAAISGFNGSDGQQICDRIESYISDTPTPYETVAANTPLKTTAPNWLAFPDPAVPPTPAYVTMEEVRALSNRVGSLQALYDAEMKKRTSGSKDALAPFRSMVADMAPMLERGFAYPGDPILANPEAKLTSDISALAENGSKITDVRRFHSAMEIDTVSRLERDLEEAKAQLRVYQKALDSASPMTPRVQLPGVVAESVTSVTIKAESSRPRVAAAPKVASTAPVETEAGKAVSGGPKVKVGPVELVLPDLKVPELKVPELKAPSIKLPFGNKEE